MNCAPPSSVMVLESATRLSPVAGTRIEEMREVCVSHELQELDSLVGLGAVKAQIGRLALRLSAEQSYRAQGAAILPAHRHLVFSGPDRRRQAQGRAGLWRNLRAARRLAQRPSRHPRSLRSRRLQSRQKNRADAGEVRGGSRRHPLCLERGLSSRRHSAVARRSAISIRSM